MSNDGLFTARHNFFKRAALLGTAIAAAGSSAMGADYVYVRKDAPAGGNGSSWEKAFREVQDALDAFKKAKPDSYDFRIFVAQGEYTPDRGTKDREKRFSVDFDNTYTRELIIVGGYQGKFPDPWQRDIEKFPTVFSGDLKKDDGSEFANRSDNSKMILTVRAQNASITLDGLTFKGASRLSAPVLVSGVTIPDYAGVCLQAISNLPGFTSVASLKQCVFKGNENSDGPGAVWTYSQYLDMKNCLFEGNRTLDGAGGAISLLQQVGDLHILRIEQNRFIGNSARFGGAVMSWRPCFFLRCIFDSNGAAVSGGAGFFDAESYFINCLMTRNTAGVSGGAVTNQSLVYSGYTNCTLAHNRAPSGSALEIPYAQFRLSNCIVWGNENEPAKPVIDLWPRFYSAQIQSSLIQGGLANVETDPSLFSTAGTIRESDPLFIRPAIGPDDVRVFGDLSYVPRLASPAIRGGLTQHGTSEVDLIQVESPNPEVMDLGCYWYTVRSCPANLNQDGDWLVNDVDFLQFVKAYSIGISFPADPKADLNRDGMVDDADFSLFCVAYDKMTCY